MDLLIFIQLLFVVAILGEAKRLGIHKKEKSISKKNMSNCSTKTLNSHKLNSHGKKGGKKNKVKGKKITVKGHTEEIQSIVELD